MTPVGSPYSSFITKSPSNTIFNNTEEKK